MTDQLRILTPTNAPRTAEDVVNDAADGGKPAALWTLSEATGPQWQYALDINDDPETTDASDVLTLLPYAGNINLTAPSAANAPHLAKSKRALLFGIEIDTSLQNTNVTLTSGTSYYAAFYIDGTTDSQASFIGSTDAAEWAGIWSSDNTLSYHSGTSATVSVDGTAVTDTRLALKTAVADGNPHLVEVVFTPDSNWNGVRMLRVPASGFRLSDEALPLALMEEPTTADKEILRSRFYAQYPQIAPSAGGGLLADDVESATEVSSPAIGQTHAILANDVQSATELSTPTLASGSSTDNLLADDVQSVTELSTPALGQIHVIVANDNESATEVTSPAIGQTHAITADDVESASEVTAPGIVSGINDLLADDVQAATEVSTPTLTLIANKQVTGTLVTCDGILRPNLTNLSWAWFDATDPGLFGAPTDQGEIELTDASGAFVIPTPNTALAFGQEGTLILRTDDGVSLGAYNLAME